MPLNEKTRSLLSDKLKFTPEQIGRLEARPDLRQETQNLLEILKLSSDRKEVRQYAIVQFKRIRESLEDLKNSNTEVLRKARSEYYTFQ